MKRQFRQGVLMVASAALWFGLMAGRAVAGSAPLTADEIVQKALARAETTASPAGRPAYRFTKQMITDDLDASGSLRERTDKVFEVFIGPGRASQKLLTINGRPPSAAELKKQEQLEESERKKIAESKSGTSKGRENLFTPELVSRYEFTLAGQSKINGRKAYCLAFKPKANLPVHKITDRFLNQVAGKLWIDAEEFEIARVQIGLQTEVTLWAGIIGTLRRCDFTLERVRLPDGAWFAGSMNGVVEGRKLWENMFMRTRSVSSNFRRDGLAMR
jgi:hypothetical protein